MDTLLQDLRYSARSLARTPGFTAVAVLCLALGIGVNTAAFSVINSMALRALPGIQRQDELVEVRIGNTEWFGPVRPAAAALPDFEELRGMQHTLEGVLASGRATAAVQFPGTSRDALSIPVAVTSGNFFTVLGVRPEHGRLYTAADDDATNPIVVVSHRFWLTRLDSAESAVGTSILLNGRAFTIAGVTARGFVGIDPSEPLDDETASPELWMPMSFAAVVRPSARDAGNAWDDRWLRVIGRKRVGLSNAEVQTELEATALRIERREPLQRRAARGEVADFGTPPGGMGEIVGAVLLLMSVPMLVLMVACANVANMLLARGAARQREIAVRMSLGAQRFRIIRQLLTESGIIAGLAAVIGVCMSLAAGSVMRALMSVPFEAPLDLQVLSFAILLTAATALLFGLVPALGTTRTDTSEILKDGGAGSGYRRSRLRSALVVAQIALSLLLLATSGVFIRTVGVMSDSTTGMERHRLVLASLDPGAMRFSPEKASGFRDRSVGRLQSLPGVAAVGTASWLPPEAPSNEQRVSHLRQDAAKGRFARTGSVGGRFFDASAIPIRAGRDFGPDDRPGAPLVAIVNEALARELNERGDYREIIGMRLRFGDDSTAFVAEVIGVAGNTTMPTRDDVRPIAYFPVAQQYAAHLAIHIRTIGDPASLLPAVRRELTDLDPSLPLLELSTIAERLERTLTGLELTGRAMLAFGALAVILAAAGVYAVMSYIVAQRTREIGVRVALGARRNAVVALVLRQALTLTVVGIAFGLAAAIAVGKLIASALHNAKAADPISVGAVVALLLVMALTASAVPALRATRVDPMIALRHD